ncbi:hypothetical protein D3C78_688110 [compost metagenome]
MGAHGLVPVAANLDAAVHALLEAGLGVVDEQRLAGLAGEGGVLVRGVGVDAVIAGQLQRPAIVVVLPREEEGVGEAVAFRRTVAVVFMGGDGVQAKARVGGRIDRQGVVVTHHDRLAVAHHQQLRREGAVEGPHRLVVLDRHVRMEAHTDTLGGALDAVGGNLRVAVVAIGVVVQAAGGELAVLVGVHLQPVAHAAVDPRAGLRGLQFALREEFVVALVRPALSRRPSFCRRVDGALEEGADLRAPRVLVAVVGVLLRRRIQARIAEELVQVGAVRAAAGDDGILFRRWPRFRRGEAVRRRRGMGFVWLRAELLEQQQFLVERLGAEQRTRLAVGGDVEAGLFRRGQDVLGPWCLAIAGHAAGFHEGAGIGFRYAGQEHGLRVLGRIGIGRWITGQRLAGHGHRGGDRQSQQEQGAGGHAGLVGECPQAAGGRGGYCFPESGLAGSAQFHVGSPLPPQGKLLDQGK